MTAALGDGHVVQIVAWFGAFWVAVLGRGPTHAGGRRLVLGLALGALLAVLGDQAFHPGDLGFSVLFVPLGLLVAAAFRSTAERRDACLRDSLRGLPAALALARVGCLAAGCCQPVPAQIAGRRAHKNPDTSGGNRHDERIPRAGAASANLSAYAFQPDGLAAGSSSWRLR